MGLSYKFGSFRLTVIQAIPIILILSTLRMKDRVIKQIEPIALAISCFAQAVGILNLYLNFSDFSHPILFIQSYALGIIQQALIVLIFRFQHTLLIISFNIIFKTLVAVFLKTFDTLEDNLIGIIVPVALDLVFLLVTYFLEKSERKTHKDLDQFRRKAMSMSKNQTLQHLPQSLLVLSENAKNCLFTNESFKKTFYIPSLCPDFSFQHALKGLYIDKLNGPNMTERLNKVLVEDDDPTSSLLNFINKAVKEDLLNIQEPPLIVLAGQMHVSTDQRWFEVKITKSKFEDQNVILITFSDITYYRSIIVSQEAKQSNDKLLATVSHELKTPLHSMLTSLRFALQASSNPKATELINLCIKNSRLLFYTITSIINYQLAQENKLKAKTSRVELKTLIQEMEFLFGTQCNEKGILFNVKVANQVPQFIHTDKEILHQVLINLIANAVKFTFSGSITFSIKPDPSFEGNLIFQIEDTGVGIKLQDQSKLFKMSDVSTTESVNTHGAGLGLTISNSLVKLLNSKSHDSSINVQSEHGKGSIFSFSVCNNNEMKNEHSIEEDLIDFLEEIESPEIKINAYSYKAIEPSKVFDGTKSHVSSPINSLFDQEDFSLIQTKHVSPNVSGSSINRRRFASDNLTVTSSLRYKNKERSISIVITPPDSGTLKASIGAQLGTLTGWVLIVDDNAFNLMVAKKIVRETGCKVKTAMHGEDAIDKVKRHFQEENEFFKLIIMDCQMPVMDGYQATRILKEMMANNEIPSCSIVALTANDTEKDKQKCKECGMDDVLSKPLKEEDMYKVFDYLK